MGKIYLKTVFYIIIFTSFLYLNVFSQSVNINFQRFSKENGLSTYGPTAVIKDSKGFIWVASQNGLNRFDGSGFKVYTHDISNPNSLSEDYIMCLCEDSDGNIWAGTISKGLNKLNRQTEKFEVFLNDPNNENSISSNNIRALVFDDGKLWIGTQNGGLNIFDIKNKKFTRLKHNPGNPLSLNNDFIWSLFKDKDGNIWVGTNGSGLDKLIRGSNTFIHYEHIHNDSLTISHNEIRTIFEDKDGFLWVGTNGGGISRLDKRSGKFKRVAFNPVVKDNLENTVVMGIEQDEYGYLWIGEYVKGLSIYHPETEKTLEIKSNANDNAIPILDGVYSIYKDKGGIIWICHEGKGLYVYNSKKSKFEHYKNNPSDQNSLGDNITWSICEDNEKNIWVAHRKGFSILNLSTKQFKHYQHDPNDENTISDNFLRYIYKDRSGYMWLSNNIGALDRFDLSTGKIIHFYTHPDDTSKIFSNIVSLIEDKEGLLWMGTYSDGLKVFNKEKTKVTTYVHNDSDINSISSNGIWNVCLDNEDNLWVATYTTGCDKYDKKTGKFTNYRHNPHDSNSLSGDIISSVYQDKNGIYWITTFGSGMDRFDIQRNTFKHYTTKEGLPDNSLYGIIEDEAGKLWISTNQGLSRFDPKTEVFVNYNTGDGLQSQEFNQNCYFKSSRGEFYFGGMNGFNIFKPSDFTENNTMPELVFTSFKIFNKEAEFPLSVTEAEEIELSYTDNFFTIEYAAIEYTNPTKIDYAYMLEGIDKEWNRVKNVRTAHYTDVSPGDYIFKVKNTNTNGIWNEKNASIKLIIKPPFWKTKWFKFLFILLIMGLIFYIYEKRIKNEKKEKEKQEDITMKLINSHEEERKKISAELHDSLGQDLVIIKNNANMALNNIKSESEVSKFIGQISEISTNALHNVRAISHNLRPVELDKLGLTDTIKSIVEMVSSSSDIKFTSEIDTIDNVFDKINEVNFCRIIQECLNNILKHSKASNASVQIKVNEEKIITTIKDDGIGFNLNDIKKNNHITSFGLMGIRERVKMLNGTLRIDSGQGEGTEFIITNPVSLT